MFGPAAEACSSRAKWQLESQAMEAYFKHLFMSNMLTFHWPKQVMWPGLTLAFERHVFNPQRKSSVKPLDRGFGSIILLHKWKVQNPILQYPVIQKVQAILSTVKTVFHSETSRLLITTSKLTLLFHKKWHVCIYRDVFSFFFFIILFAYWSAWVKNNINIYCLFLFTASWCDPFKNVSVYKTLHR